MQLNRSGVSNQQPINQGAEAFRKNLQIWKFLQLMKINASADANLNRDLFLFPLVAFR